jgi:hypothetical protein
VEDWQLIGLETKRQKVNKRENKMTNVEKVGEKLKSIEKAGIMEIPDAIFNEIYSTEEELNDEEVAKLMLKCLDNYFPNIELTTEGN